MNWLFLQIDSSDSGSYIRTRRKKKTHHSYRTRYAQNEETAPNRLVTRALYDTDVEEVCFLHTVSSLSSDVLIMTPM